MGFERKMIGAVLAATLPAVALAQTLDSAATKPVDRPAALAEAARAADLWVDGLRTYRRIPAVSTALVDGDATVFAKGYGTIDRRGRVAAGADTIYSVCSVAKLFTSVALMQQWEAGKVRLDEPVTTYLPWATLAPDTRDSVPVSLRAILTHSAGLPRDSDYPYWTGPDFRFPSQRELRAKLASQAPLYPASTTYQYSNLGMTLIGETVAATSGLPFATYLRDKVLTPMGLTATYAGVPAELYGTRLAVGWGALQPDGGRPALKIFDPAGLTPAAGVSSSVADLARFASWHLRVLRTGQAEVLRPSTLREMQRVQFESVDGKIKAGLGYNLRDSEGTRLVGHSGSCPGYRSAVYVVPKAGLGAAAAMNAMDDANAVATTLLQLAQTRLETTPYDPPAGEALDLAAYAGRYDGQPWRADFALVPWAGGLISIQLDGAPVDKRLERFKPLGGDRFIVIDASGEEREVIQFQRNAKGEVLGYTQHSNVRRRKAPLAAWNRAA